MTKKSLLHRPNRFIIKMREDINNPKDALRAGIFYLNRGERKRTLFYVGLLGAFSALMARGNSGMNVERQLNPTNYRENIVDIHTPLRTDPHRESVAIYTLDSLRNVNESPTSDFYSFESR